ncbi:MAG: glycosyltransferase family 2 protein [Bacteroidales bacterium]
MEEIKACPNDELPPVSIVICIWDKVNLLRNHIQHFLDQEYPNFEIIVVNVTYDDFYDEALEAWVNNIPNLELINIYEKNNFSKSKIFPLSIGIKAAKNEYIVTTNLTCIPSSVFWLRTLVSSSCNFKYSNVIGITNYKKRPKLSNKLHRYALNISNYKMLSYAYYKMPLSINPKNFLFTKSNFFNIKNITQYFNINNDGTCVLNKLAKKKNSTICFLDYAQTQETEFNKLHKDLANDISNLKFAKKYPRFLNAFYAISLLLFIICLVLLVVFFKIYILPASLFIIRTFLWFKYKFRSLTKLNQSDLKKGIILYEFIILILYPIAYFRTLRTKHAY